MKKKPYILAEETALKYPITWIERGGPGSGHHGHRGRPGEVGGSLPSGESAGIEDYDAYLEEHGMEATLNALRPKLAVAAQVVYDNWQQDEEGVDEEYGTGGICDAIASVMGWEIVGELSKVSTVDAGQPGDDHAWIIAYNNKEAFGIDLPASVYETGFDFQWTKIEGVTIRPDNIEIFEMPHDDLEYFPDIDEEIYFAERVSPWGALIIPSYHSANTERAKKEHQEQRNLGDRDKKVLDEA